MARKTFKIDPLDLNKDVGIGIGLPMGGDKFGRFNLLYNTKDQILSSLKNLILTMKGERIMEPEFGTNIYRLLFENIREDVLEKRVRQDIITSCKRWLPVLKIDFVGAKINEHTMTITIAFKVPDYNKEDTLKLDVNR